MSDYQVHPSSYKDPAGFVFRNNTTYYRQVNESYASNYQLLMESGLYDMLTRNEWLISHIEVNENITGDTNCYKTILPQQIPFISYPYEWSFDMLKDAALLTIKINKIAIQYGMILKDATAFNIQFLSGKPIFIDTLSFVKYDGITPWIAYRQFCESFLFPLYLSHYAGADMTRMLSIYPEGIPLLITARLLPFKSRFKLGVWLHVFLQKRIFQANIDSPLKRTGFSKGQLVILLDGLAIAGKNLKKIPDSIWSNYYSETILGNQYLEEKEKIFHEFVDMISFRSVIDLGANNGHFSKIVMKKADWVVSTDMDSHCINSLYKFNKENAGLNILPLLVDLSNPSPGIGFGNLERASFIERAKSDLLLALALIHHLSISKNIPFMRIAELFQAMSRILIIEFVPKEDIKVKELLKHKNDIYDNYSELSFEKSFTEYFNIMEKRLIPGTGRKLYLMSRKP